MTPIQATSKSRRLYMFRGRGTSLQGRPRMHQSVSLHVSVNENWEIVERAHKLPSKKKRLCPASLHSLMGAVDSNRRSSKKHYNLIV